MCEVLKNTISGFLELLSKRCGHRKSRGVVSIGVLRVIALRYGPFRVDNYIALKVLEDLLPRF